MNLDVRPYKPSDRAAVRNICCMTGFMGSPVDELFNDRESFADFFTRYYTDYEPENALVAEVDGEVIGYLITCAHYRRYPFMQVWISLRYTLPRILRNWVTGAYDDQSRRFLRWFVTRSWRETPTAPPRSAHFHMNLLPAHRSGTVGLRLLKAWIQLLDKQGIKSVYAQIQTYENRRPVKVFERLGFRFYDRRVITKFKAFNRGLVHVDTYVRTS